MSTSTSTLPSVIDRLRAFAAWLEQQSTDVREMAAQYPTPTFAQELADTYLMLLIFAGVGRTDSDVGASVVFAELRQAIIDLAVKQLMVSAPRCDYTTRAAERHALCESLAALDAFVATGYAPQPLAFPYSKPMLRSWQSLGHEISAYQARASAGDAARTAGVALVALNLDVSEAKGSLEARGTIYRCFITTLRGTLAPAHPDAELLERVEHTAITIGHPRDGSFLIAETDFGREHPEICVRAQVTYRNGKTWVKMLKSPSSRVFDRLRALGARLDERTLSWGISRTVPISQLFREMSGLAGSIEYTTA